MLMTPLSKDISGIFSYLMRDAWWICSSLRTVLILPSVCPISNIILNGTNLTVPNTLKNYSILYCYNRMYNIYIYITKRD